MFWKSQHHEWNAVIESDELEKVTRYQHVDFEAVLLKLDKEMKNMQERVEFLQKEYPCLFIHFLKKSG